MMRVGSGPLTLPIWRPFGARLNVTILHAVCKQWFHIAFDRLPRYTHASQPVKWRASKFYQHILEQGKIELFWWATMKTATGYIIPMNELIQCELCTWAATGGLVGAIKWARDNAHPRGAPTCSNAAKTGNLELLKWLRAESCPWDSWTCSEAARRGHLEILKWARENNCPWNGRTCADAAAGGHLEVLKWAMENGCRWDSRTLAYAAQHDHLEIWKWARANGCRGTKRRTYYRQNRETIWKYSTGRKQTGVRGSSNDDVPVLF